MKFLEKNTQVILNLLLACGIFSIVLSATVWSSAALTVVASLITLGIGYLNIHLLLRINVELENERKDNRRRDAVRKVYDRFINERNNFWEVMDSRPYSQNEAKLAVTKLSRYDAELLTVSNYIGRLDLTKGQRGMVQFSIDVLQEIVGNIRSELLRFTEAENVKNPKARSAIADYFNISIELCRGIEWFLMAAEDNNADELQEVCTQMKIVHSQAKGYRPAVYRQTAG